MKGRSVVRELPTRWIAFSLPYDPVRSPKFNEYAKSFPLRTFDMNTKSWCFPSTVAPLVLQSAYEMGLLSKTQYEEGRKVVFAAFPFDEGNKRGLAKAYAALGLTFGAPWWLVETAWKGWKYRLNDALDVDGIDRVDAAFNVLREAFEGDVQQAALKINQDVSEEDL